MNQAFAVAVVTGSILAFALAAQIGHLRAAGRREPTVTRAPQSFATLAPYFLWIPYAALTVGPSIEPPGAIVWLGLVLSVGGVAFAIWSITVIGRHYDVTLEIHADHEIVRTGPYGIVRHPIYLGLITHTLGGCLATGNPIFIALALVAAVPAYHARAVTEERLLRTRFGAAYEDYARDVPMLLPIPR